MHNVHVISCLNVRSDEWVVGYKYEGKICTRTMYSNRQPTLGEIKRELAEVLGFF